MMTSSLSAHTPRLIVSFSYDKLRWSIVIGQDMVRCCCIEMIVSYTPRPPSCHTNVTCMIFRRPWRDLQPADKLQRNQTRPIQEEFGRHFCEIFEKKNIRNKPCSPSLLYNLKTTGQILVQFYSVYRLSWFPKSIKSVRIRPWTLTLIVRIDCSAQFVLPMHSLFNFILWHCVIFCTKWRLNCSINAEYNGCDFHRLPPINR